MEGEIDSEQSQFVPQSGDEDNLWEILGIIAEKGNKYKVKWAGVDPKTEKPWGNSWVKKSDVTPDVVEEWKEKQALKIRRKSSTKTLSKAGSKKSRASTERPDSTSTTTMRRGRSSVASTTNQARSPSASRSPPPPTSISASPRKTTGKRKLAVANSPHSSSDLEFPDILTVLQGVREASEPQKKKRKVSEEVPVVQPRASTSSLKIASSSKPSRLEGTKMANERRQQHVLSEHEEEDAEERGVSKLTEPGLDKSKSGGQPNKSATRRTKAKVKTIFGTNAVAASNSKGKGRAEPNGKSLGKKSAPVVLSDDDDDEGSGIEVMNQLTQNEESDEDDWDPQLATKQSKPKFKPRTTPSIPPRIPRPTPSETSKKVSEPEVVDEDEMEENDDMDDFTKKRLDEFDESMRRLDEEATTGSERATAIPYGESDVDPIAAEIMYPPVEGDPGPSKQKSTKLGTLQREPTLPNDVPEILLQPPASPPPQSSRPIPGTPRSSLKSKMRPRTPRSGAGSMVSFADIPEPPTTDLDLPAVEPLPAIEPLPAVEPLPAKEVNGKVNGASKPQNKPKLGPIPQISPSKFYPHLPASSLIDTTIEDAEPEVEEPMSSIEQFDSPEKPAHVRVVPALPNRRKDTGKGKQREQSPVEDEEFWASDIVLDIEKMREREAQKQAEKRREEQPEASKRRSLEDVIQQHLSSKEDSDRASSAPRSPSSSPPPPPPQETLDDGYDDFYVDEPTDYQDTQMEQDEVPPAAPQYLPQEEEESTQDILHELEVQQAVGTSGASPSPPPEREPEPEPEPESVPEPEQQLDLLEEPAEEEDEALDVSMEPQIGTQGVDLEYPPEEEPEPQPVPPAQGRLVEGTQEIPPTLSTNQDEASQESNQTSMSIDSTEQKKHISYMNLLNAKSEEIGDLAKQLQDERSQKEELSTRVTALEEQLRLAHVLASNAQNATIDDLTQQLAALNTKFVDSNLAFAAEREAWGKRQDTLQNQMNAIQSQNDNVMIMFREENGRADGLLKGKRELRKELEITQKQVREAVGIQKAFYEKRIEKLSAKRDEAVAMSAMLVKRNARTEEDHLMRQLADEAPELRELLRKAKDKNRDLKSRLQKAKKANAELRVQLDERWQEPGSGSDRDGSGSLERSEDGRSPTPQDDLPDSEDDDTHLHALVPADGEDDGEGSEDDPEDDPEDEVVRCTWRKEDDKMCNALFKTQAKLEAHVFDAGHLPRPSSPLDGLD